MFPSGLNVQTSLGGGTTIAQGVWIEALCTAGLVFTIIMLAKEKHQATFIAPVGIGLSLFIGELVAVYYTGGSLNPARSFGPAAVLHDFKSDQWVYWVGPPIGSVLAFVFYRLMKILEYEMANPGQDGDYKTDPTQNPNHELAIVQEERAAEVEEIQIIEEEGGFENMEVDVGSIAGSVETDVRNTGALACTNERARLPGSRREPDLEAQQGLDSPAQAVEQRSPASIYLDQVRSKRRERTRGDL